jgi:hypothetical protein
LLRTEEEKLEAADAMGDDEDLDAMFDLSKKKKKKKKKKEEVVVAEGGDDDDDGEKDYTYPEVRQNQ